MGLDFESYNYYMLLLVFGEFSYLFVICKNCVNNGWYGIKECVWLCLNRLFISRLYDI